MGEEDMGRETVDEGPIGKGQGHSDAGEQVAPVLPAYGLAPEGELEQTHPMMVALQLAGQRVQDLTRALRYKAADLEQQRGYARRLEQRLEPQTKELEQTERALASWRMTAMERRDKYEALHARQEDIFRAGKLAVEDVESRLKAVRKQRDAANRRASAAEKKVGELVEIRARLQKRAK